MPVKKKVEKVSSKSKKSGKDDEEEIVLKAEVEESAADKLRSEGIITTFAKFVNLKFLKLIPNLHIIAIIDNK